MPLLYLSQLDKVTEISKEQVERVGLLQNIVLGLEDKVSLSLSGPATLVEGKRGILYSGL